MHIACDRSSVLFWGMAIRYALPVLWMTSLFHIIALWYVMCVAKRR